MTERKFFQIRSLGCKVNQYDGDRIAEILGHLGFTRVLDGVPDIFILNGCSVTGRASQKARQALRAARKNWPKSRIVLSGCETALLERTGEAPPEIDGLLPLRPTREIVESLLVQIGLLSGERHDQIAGDVQTGSLRTRAFLKIQDGCNQFCSYCIVPHLRGRERSVSFDEVIEEGRKLASKGFREIVLTGIHLGRYEFGLVPLLRELERLPDLKRIRLSSIEPIEISDDLIGWLEASPAACPHLHLPVQAGTDEVLRAMNRPYTISQFEEIVAKVRRGLPMLGLSTDLIVGFPGETEELFSKGLEFVKRMSFSRMHIFRYSARPGTPAASMDGGVSNQDKHDRSKAVERVWKASAAAFHASFAGRNVEVLWETCVSGVWQGFSREYIPCRLKKGVPAGANQVSLQHVIQANAAGVEVG